MRALAVFLLLLPNVVLAAEKCPLPRPLTFHVEKEIRRDTVGFTEGLEFRDGALWELTRDFFGDSRINRIDLATGHVSSLVMLESYFGEGMTFFGKLYQMTWREGRVFVFDEATMRRLPKLRNPREGWGLTHDETQLIASDGSSRLFFLSPHDFSTRRTLKVQNGGRFLENINELDMRKAPSGPMSSRTGTW